MNLSHVELMIVVAIIAELAVPLIGLTYLRSTREKHQK